MHLFDIYGSILTKRTEIGFIELDLLLHFPHLPSYKLKCFLIFGQQ